MEQISQILPEQRFNRLRQKPQTFWLTGLSGSGKSTLAFLLEKKLFETGYYPMVLDGDLIRNGLNKDLGFSEEDRGENIRRIAEVASILNKAGIIVISSFISPLASLRNTARQIIGQEYFKEVFVDCPLPVCERRDVKGLYRKARKGEIKEFTGIDSPYETPENPDLTLPTSEFSADESLNQLYRYALPLIQFHE